MKVWVSISQACDECGGSARIAVASSAPLAAKQDTASVGGFCTRTAVVEIEVDGDVIDTEDLARES